MLHSRQTRCVECVIRSSDWSSCGFLILFEEFNFNELKRSALLSHMILHLFASHLGCDVSAGNDDTFRRDCRSPSLHTASRLHTDMWDTKTRDIRDMILCIIRDLVTVGSIETATKLVVHSTPKQRSRKCSLSLSLSLHTDSFYTHEKFSTSFYFSSIQTAFILLEQLQHEWIINNMKRHEGHETQWKGHIWIFLASHTCFIILCLYQPQHHI